MAVAEIGVDGNVEVSTPTLEQITEAQVQDASVRRSQALEAVNGPLRRRRKGALSSAVAAGANTKKMAAAKAVAKKLSAAYAALCDFCGFKKTVQEESMRRKRRKRRRNKGSSSFTVVGGAAVESCMDPASDDPETFSCECLEEGMQQCQGKNDVVKCLRNILCASSELNVCQKWKADACFSKQRGQFAGALLMRRSNMTAKATGTVEASGTVDDAVAGKCTSETQ